MPIYNGSRKIKEVYHGGRKIKEVYHGPNKVFTGLPDEIMIDNFEDRSTSLGIWNFSGVPMTISAYGTGVEAGNGKGDAWSKNDVLPHWQSRVEHKIYQVTDDEQMSSILMGDESSNLYAEFSENSWRLGNYDGTSWTVMASGGGFGLTSGSVVSLERRGSTTASFLHNGSVVGTGQLASNVALGLKTGFTLRANNVFIIWFRSPVIDDIRVVPL